MYPHQESNLEYRFRKPRLYPFNYRGIIFEGLHSFSALTASESRPKQSVDCILRILRLTPLLCTAGRARTDTDITAQGIFLPATVFTANIVCCLWSGLYLYHFTGTSRQVSTRSLSGFARYCHFTGFTEFEKFYFESFLPSTQIILSKSLVYTNFTTAALVIITLYFYP